MYLLMPSFYSTEASHECKEDGFEFKNDDQTEIVLLGSLSFSSTWYILSAMFIHIDARCVLRIRVCSFFGYFVYKYRNIELQY